MLRVILTGGDIHNNVGSVLFADNNAHILLEDKTTLEVPMGNISLITPYKSETWIVSYDVDYDNSPTEYVNDLVVENTNLIDLRNNIRLQYPNGMVCFMKIHKCK